MDPEEISLAGDTTLGDEPIAVRTLDVPDSENYPDDVSSLCSRSHLGGAVPPPISSVGLDAVKQAPPGSSRSLGRKGFFGGASYAHQIMFQTHSKSSHSSSRIQSPQKEPDIGQSMTDGVLRMIVTDTYQDEDEPSLMASVGVEAAMEGPQRKKRGCPMKCCAAYIPNWIANESSTMKNIILVSTILLVGSLIILVAALASMSGGGGSSDNEPKAITGAPTVPTAPTGTDEQTPPSGPIFIDDSSPLDPLDPTDPSDPMESSSSRTTFYIGADRFQDSELAPQKLGQLPHTDEGGEFMVHLGDWNKIDENPECDEEAYSDMFNVLGQSSVPVYLLPGESESAECEDASTAMSSWRYYFTEFPLQFWDKPPFKVARQDDRPEQFAFVLRQVLYVGVNVVGETGKWVPEGEEEDWAERTEAAWSWVQENVATYRSDLEAMVIFANSGPYETDLTDEKFYEPLMTVMQNSAETSNDFTDLAVLLIVKGESSMESYSVTPNFEEVRDLTVAKVQGRFWPPMRVIFDTDLNSVRINQANWFDRLSAPATARNAGDDR
uniref:Calcineurin-like phosphoesterase domain-containing protein n=1 Tax=Attheya septentrionalis TaxID=420275 RepID=A0A7S2U6X3_9STRA|mmetsp:Transcript_13050/g.23669  ORF Transcript_13050/g.23669 Transcript_13050/m.23669 type:complete len:552 (+) Transcript_13050:251-1906(+)